MIPTSLTPHGFPYSVYTRGHVYLTSPRARETAPRGGLRADTTTGPKSEPCTPRHSHAEERRPPYPTRARRSGVTASGQLRSEAVANDFAPPLPHRLLLLRCRLRMLCEDLLDLGVRCHVFVHASVNAGGLTDAQLRLFVHGDALAKALLRHSARTGEAKKHTS